MIPEFFVRASVSTVLNAVLATNVFLIFLVILLSNEKLLVRSGHKLLSVFVLLSALRFLMPIELPIATNVKANELASHIILHCHKRLPLLKGQSFSFFSIFAIIWGTGFLIGLLYLFCSYFSLRNRIVLYGKELTGASPYQDIIEEICRSQKKSNHFRVIELPGLSSPVLFGIIHPKILIPEHFTLPEPQLRMILRHETNHHFHHDLLLKGIVQLIVLAYWWDPFSYALLHQADIILEMNVDHTLTRSDKQITTDYMNCLIAVASGATRKDYPANTIALGFLSSNNSDLKRRFQLLTNNQEKKQYAFCTLLFTMFLGLFICSYLFIVEAYSSPEYILTQSGNTDEEGLHYYFSSAEDTYFISNADGTYDYFINGVYMETVQSLEYYSEDIPVYARDSIVSP